MTLSEADTCAKLIYPALHTPGWTEDLIRREETAGAVEIVDGQPRKRSNGRVDYILRVKVTSEAQPIAVGLIEARNYDRKAVNPNAKADEDLRKPEEFLDLIEAKGKEVAEALVKLRESK
jgi:type I site-specific restriction endonuclease